MNTTKITPKDFFLHLGATVALYASVIAIINLAFSVINYWLPDKLAGYFSPSMIAWPVSMLVILVPLLYVIEYFILRDIKRIPEKGEIWIRRWRIYLTLFLTGALIVGDLIALINVYLNGEISARFIYKILFVLVLSAIIFAYYLMTRIQTDPMQPSSNSKKQNILAWIGLVIVLASIICGLIVSGSPYKQRNIRFDTQRVSDLSNIQWQIVNHWQSKGRLPESLLLLEDTISGFKIPKDPKTDALYEFKVLNSSATVSGNTVQRPSFELCADFALPTQDNENRGNYYGYSSNAIKSVDYYGGDNWQHEGGRSCFTRYIDPDKYPINKK